MAPETDRHSRVFARIGRRRKPRLRKLGLRARVTAIFTIGALALSSILAVVLFFETRSLILNGQVDALRSQAIANAEIVRQTLEPGDVYSVLSSLQSTDSALYYRGGWYGTYFTGETAIPLAAEKKVPPALVSMVLSGHAGQQTFSAGGTPQYAIGIPIAGGAADYFEVFGLTSVQTTIHQLLGVLAIAALATTVGGAIVGRWAAGRSLRPLREVADAARAIAGGQLETRLETADVAELSVLASSFNRMVNRLQDRIERDARFTSDVSHELRSPLTTLSASLSVLEARSPELPERAQQAVELAGAEIRRFQRMVSDLLEISRLDAGSADLVLEEVTVGELVRRTAHTASATYSPVSETSQAKGRRGRKERRGTPFPVIVPADVENRHVLVDKRRIERVIANLVENATLYGGGVTKVEVEGRPGAVRISVEDEGPGIPADERERIFERFSRGSSGRRRGTSEGTGLGLALVAEHVRLHGGRVWVESPPSTGSATLNGVNGSSADAAAASRGSGGPSATNGIGTSVADTSHSPNGSRARSGRGSTKGIGGNGSSSINEGNGSDDATAGVNVDRAGATGARFVIELPAGPAEEPHEHEMDPA
jgi:signal transduction histidine kinase